MSSDPRRRRAVLGGVAVLLVVAAALVGLRARTAQEERVPQGIAYRIVYNGEQLAGGRRRVFTDVLEVHRPGLASRLTHDGAGVDGPVVAGDVFATDGVYGVRSDDGGPATAHRAHPADGLPPAVDLRLEPALTVAARIGLVRTGGTETVAGIRCRVYLSAEPLDQGSWHPPQGGDEAQSCVSADGHLLRDSWSVNGTALLTHRARSVEQLPAGPFDPLAGLVVDRVVPDQPGTGATMVPSPAPSPMAVRVPSPPPHLNRTGTFEVVQYSPFRRGGLLAVSERQAFSHEADTVTLTQTTTQVDASGPQPSGEPVDLGDLGQGVLVPGPQGLAITVLVSDTVKMVVVGSLGERELLAWVRSLVPVR